MKKISIWAKAHPQQARVFIVISYLLLNVLGIVIGKLLNQLSIEIPLLILNASIVIFIIAAIAYPSKNKKRNYVFHKTCDGILITSTFIMIVFAGNRYGSISGFLASSTNINEVFATSIKDSSKYSYKSIEAFKLSMKDKDGKMLKWKERKKLLKTQLKEIRKSAGLSKGEKVVLTILCVIVAIGLVYLLAGAACSLSCSGAEGLAFLVGIGGLAVLAYLFVIAMRAIYKKKKQPAIPTENKPAEETQKVDGD